MADKQEDPFALDPVSVDRIVRVKINQTPVTFPLIEQWFEKIQEARKELPGSSVRVIGPYSVEVEQFSGEDPFE